jgi:hypothetical protein
MAITIGTVTINRNPVPRHNWSKQRYNQYTRITADGGRKTYDNGPTVLTGTLVLKAVAKSEGDILRTYITDTAVFGKNSFTITPPANTDLGAGDGVAITTAYFEGDSLEGVFQLSPNGLLYTITLPYWKLL